MLGECVRPPIGEGCVCPVHANAWGMCVDVMKYSPRGEGFMYMSSI